jgi:hypothetical protein
MAIAGYTKTCGKNQGGGLALHIANIADVTSMTKGTGVQSYSTITMASGKVFYAYTLEQDTITRTETIEANKGAYKVTNVITLDLGKLSQLNRDAIHELLATNDCGYCLIFTDNNSQRWVIGYNDTDVKTRPARITGEVDTVAADIMEPTSSVITFTAVNTEKARVLTGTIPVT